MRGDHLGACPFSTPESPFGQGAIERYTEYRQPRSRDL